MHYGGRQPPQAFVARLNRFFQESRPEGFSLSVKWMEDECVCPPPKRRRIGGKQLDPAAANEDASTYMYNSYIYIYRQRHKGVQ